MTISRLEQAIQRYEASIALLKATPKEELLPSWVLDILTARDEVQMALEDTTQTSGQNLDTINQLDRVLKDNAGAIAQVRETNCKSANWQESFNPNEKSWWWFLEAPKPERWSDKLDWLWNAVSVTCLTISFGLVGDISSRFLAGGPDTFGALAVSVQSVLTLLAAGGALTKAGQEGGKRLLGRLKLQEQNWQEIGATSSFVLVSGLVALRLSLPQIASIYTNSGMNNYKQGDWGSAGENFQRALKLNPDSAEAHFWLGRLYEDLQKPDDAKTQYLLALQSGDVRATNNLARIYILNKNYSAATSLLLKVLDTERQNKLDSETKHAVLKNLGWARLQLEDYPGADLYLTEAINLQKSSELGKDIAGPHCLLAQVMEAQDNKKGALAEWESCNKYANSFNSDGDSWVITAQKRLAAKEAHK